MNSVVASNAKKKLCGTFKLIMQSDEGQRKVVQENLVVNNLYTQLAYLLAGQVTDRAINRIALGTGTAPASASDTNITHLSPAVYLTATVTYPSIYAVRCTVQWANTVVKSEFISEAGLFFEGSTGLAARVVFGQMKKNLGWTWTIQWTLNYGIS